MRPVVLAKKSLGDLVRRWAGQRLVLAPVRRETIEFEPVTAADEICLNYRNTRSPVKRFFFPASEALLRFDFKAAPEQRVAEAPSGARPAILFGVRPCEARSLTLLDRVFLGGDYNDPYYAKRREATAIVALACDRFALTCFCTSVGGGPADRTGADLFLLDAGHAFIVEALSARGAALLDGVGLAEADARTVEEAQQATAELAAAIPTVAGLDQVAQPGVEVFNDPRWQAMCERCLGCAACSFLCPTCHCFDIQDDVLDQAGQRVRNYDTCMFAQFTLHASGHNPRPDKLQRVRQRMMHKFHYFPENFGAMACVGCGRCIRVCPAGNDMRQWLRTFVEICSNR